MFVLMTHRHRLAGPHLVAGQLHASEIVSLYEQLNAIWHAWHIPPVHRRRQAHRQVHPLLWHLKKLTLLLIQHNSGF